MSLLIAIKSCELDRDRGYHDVIRNMWGRDILNADLQFFMGKFDDNLIARPQDEVYLNAPDDYDGLPFKTQAILRYALENNYEYIFLCDTDTYLIPDKLNQSGFESFDYFGVNSRPWGQTFSYDAVDRWKNSHPLEKCYPWCSGGFGYFLSHKAAEFIVGKTPNIWAEDLWVGQVLGPLYNQGIIRMGNMPPGISWHFPQNVYRSRYDLSFGWMEKMYREHR